MGSGFAKMKKQARQLERIQEEMKKKTFEGSSGNGLVTVTLSGDRELQNISIKPDCVDPTDVEGLEDLIREAFAHAYGQATEADSAFDLSKLLG